MTRRFVLVPLLLMLALLYPRSAAAQQDEPSWPRLYVSLDGTYRAIYPTTDQTITFTEFAEDGTFNAVFSHRREPTYGATVGVRAWGALGFGVAVTRIESSARATIEADLPHPFFFDRMRHVSGTTDTLSHTELAVHGQVRIYVPVRSSFDVVLFGGPSRWQVEQAVLEGVDYTSEYPYDTAEFKGAIVSNQQVHVWGYNGGVDVSFYPQHNIGFGGLIEIATANVPLTRSDGSTVDANIGGIRFGGGLRLRF